MSANLLSLVYPIADALQLKVGLHCQKDKPARIVNLNFGDADRDVEVSPGIKIPVKMEIKASHVAKDMSVALLRVKEDLYLMLWYHASTDTLTLDLIDMSLSQVSEAKLKDMEHPDDLWQALKPGIVASFTKTHRENNWTKIDVVDSVEP